MNEILPARNLDLPESDGFSGKKRLELAREVFGVHRNNFHAAVNGICSWG